MRLLNNALVEALAGMSRFDAAAAERLDTELSVDGDLGLAAVLLAAAAPGSLIELAGEENALGDFVKVQATRANQIRCGQCGPERSSARPPYATRRDG